MTSLSFYIGNGVLKCALTRKLPKQLPEVLSWHKIELTQPEIFDTKVLEDQVFRSLETMAKECRETFLKLNISDKKIDKLFYIIASPWHFSETKTLRTEKDKAFQVKEETINEMVNNIDPAIALKYSGQGVPLEKKIIQISLNGYPTTSPLGKKTKKLEVSIVESFIDADFLKTIKSIITRYFQAKEEHSHSLALASFSVLRNIFNEKEDFLLINVTSLLSEVGLIKEGILYETATIPIGTYKLLENLKSKLNLSTEAAVSVIRLYQTKQLEENLKAKVDVILDEFKKEWLPKLRDVFSHLSLGVSLPSTCFFLSLPPFTTVFPSLLDGEEYTQFSFHDGKFKVESLIDSSFQNYLKFASGEVDSTIAIMALFANINK